MLEDVYLEYLIKRKTDSRQKAIIGGIIAAGVIVTLLLLYLIFGLGYTFAGTPYGSFVFSIGFVLIAFAWYGAYLAINMQRIEFEYILTNSALDIDKVLAKKGRKPFISLDFKEITICAAVDDSEHNSDYKNITPEKIYDAIGDKSKGGIYFVDFDDDGKRARLLFQPPYKLISSAKKYNMRKIFVLE